MPDERLTRIGLLAWREEIHVKAWGDPVSGGTFDKCNAGQVMEAVIIASAWAQSGFEDGERRVTP